MVTSEDGDGAACFSPWLSRLDRVAEGSGLSHQRSGKAGTSTGSGCQVGRSGARATGEEAPAGSTRGLAARPWAVDSRPPPAVPAPSPRLMTLRKKTTSLLP